jgi:microsomal epoxide hydrolase
MGYSLFPAEILPVPEVWAQETGIMKFFKRHERGGHFAALECPEELWEDVETFVESVKWTW